ncbi:hypothetical protein LT679_15240 [Mucilaginibacter roseus]|uniref:HEPN domain-containing protein n=1 Tax=Mucilaginibacter roseus TaxID=1528868 RepID=A0ABS8U8J3_9SPHI|nr:hypothetical protein [Mucilaginibacter roseus]MCD8741968.1 hypothetical protein [Mucilaginibacter roseus]
MGTYIGNIAPWEQYPKHLRFSEVMNPLKVVINFFSSGRPKDHREDLKEWRYYVLTDKYYKDQHGAGHILFIYDQNVQLIEALHLLLLKNKDRWPRLEDIIEEQITQEKSDWIYFPKNLSVKELANPYKAIQKCFKKISPQEYRDYLHEWLHTALYNNAADETMMAGEIIEVYDNIRKLYSAAWLIHQRETNETITHKSWGRGKESNQPKEAIDRESTIALREIDPQLSNKQQSIVEKIKNLIVERIPGVSMIYLIGKSSKPSIYYLLILINDSEKVAEHEAANKIEDNCRFLGTLFAMVHKMATATEGLKTEKRFWHNTLYKSINLYKASEAESLSAHAIDDQIWLDKAEKDWNRWGIQGKEFMKGVVRYIEDNNYTLALFSLHQATESSLIGIIRAVLGYRITVHNLSKMIKMTFAIYGRDQKIPATQHH